MADVLSFNGLDGGARVAVGDVVIIPDGVEAAAPTTPAGTSKLRNAGGPEIAGYFMRPMIGGRKSQGLHGYNGVDLAAAIGTPVMASAAGTVTVARSFGYNGGYGQYIVINHSNGTQTLYSHLSSVIVSQGRQALADRGLAGAHQPDQHDAAPGQDLGIGRARAWCNGQGEAFLQGGVACHDAIRLAQRRRARPRGWVWRRPSRPPATTPS